MQSAKRLRSRATIAELTSYRSSTFRRKLYRADTPKRNGWSAFRSEGPNRRLSKHYRLGGAVAVEDHKRIWNPTTHLRHAAAQDCPSGMYSGFGLTKLITAKGLCLLRFVTSGFGHLLARPLAVGSVGMSLSATEPKNQGNSGSATVSGQNSQWDCLLPIEPTNSPRIAFPIPQFAPGSCESHT
jgi:hypothetical protein